MLDPRNQRVESIAFMLRAGMSVEDIKKSLKKADELRAEAHKILNEYEDETYKTFLASVADAN